ncbi:hypothetical protein FQN51_007033 [Onygenales sp. PD_10]|nr:hypothetical protein FQN51_007033 [Onygenales sp. PD_10]
MEQQKLTVTLTPVNYIDPIPRRVLTITEETDVIVIGRSSKAAAKDLIPARDNAWFDSRVMSRNHAIIRVSPQKQEATIMDTDSMHGTCLNGTKLVANNKTILMNRDVLTFGAKVTRGSESFEPLKVRLVLSWDTELTNPSEGPTNTGNHHSENTFVVPDDDDDDQDFDDPDADDIFQQTGEVEALSPAPSPDANSDAVSIHSSAGGDRPESSPPSSPLSKDESQDAANPVDKDSNPHSLLDKSFSTGDSIRLPIPAAPVLHPQPPPSHLTPCEHNLSKHLYHANTPDESDQVSYDDGGPYSPSDSEADRSDDLGSVHDTSAIGASSPQSGHFNLNTSAYPNTTDAPPTYEPNKNVYETYQSNVFPSENIANGPISNDIGYNKFHYNPREDRAPLREMTGLSFAAEQNETIHNPGWALGMQRAPSPSDKAMAKPTTHENRAPIDQDQRPQPRFLPISSLPNPPYSKPRPSPLPSQPTTEDAPEFPHLPPIRPPYSDGPFTSPAHKEIGLSGDKCVPQPTLDCLRSGPGPWNSRRDDPTRGNNLCFNTSFDPYSSTMTAQEYQSFWQDDLENKIPPPPVSSAYYSPRTSRSNAPLKSSTLPTTIPVANMVDGPNQNTELSQPADSLKRKAPEIEEEEETNLSGDDESMPDAQPREIPIRLQPSPDYCPGKPREEPETSAVVSETQGPPQKKQKTETLRPSEGSNFGRYAASAFLGVAVGGIGAIAALASLPPNFFG